MTNIKAWIAAFRLRTLPLSVSGIWVGCALGQRCLTELKPSISVTNDIEFSAGIITLLVSPVFWLAILATLCFQVLSNLANDYGDGIKGTDNPSRIGPQRAVQSGVISKIAMRRAIVVMSIWSLLIVFALIFSAFDVETQLGVSVLYVALGVAAIVAAIKYTVGKSAYGYHGLGDIFVFIFFGLVSVLGSYYLMTLSFAPGLILPASAIGLLSTSVLHLNNMRDVENDKNYNKITLAVRLGNKGSKMYHYLLLTIAMLLFAIYSFLNYKSILALVYLIGYIPLVLHIIRVKKNKNLQDLDPELQTVAISTFGIALLFGLAQLIQ